MSSFHRGDWLSLMQSIATLVAVAGAFGVVFLQNRLESRRAEASAAKDRVRARYRASAYAEALIGNAINAAKELVESAEEIAQRQERMVNLSLETGRLDASAEALAAAMHQSLPTEIMQQVLAAWSAAQLCTRAAHRTHHVKAMSTARLAEYCHLQLTALEEVRATVVLSREKWEKALAEP